MKKCSCLILLLVLFSCSSGRSGDTVAETATASQAQTARTDMSVQYSLEVVPANADRNAALTAIPRGFKSSGADIEWLVNDALSGKGQTFRTKDVHRGDSVRAKAEVSGREISSNVIQIGNTPPELTKVKLMPEVCRPGDGMYVDAEAEDVDGDIPTILYEWTKNGQPAGTGNAIEGNVKRGDKITIKVTPFDGESKGPAVTVATAVRNMPPAIVDHNEFEFDGKVWTFQVKASDPDGDPLAYSLKEGPKRMSINPESGLVTWSVPDDFTGKTAFTVVVKDGHGGEATYTANVNIRTERQNNFGSARSAHAHP
jgi:hypothetical protein